MPLSAKELSAIEAQLENEQLLVQKYKLFASSCADPQLRAECEQVAAQHQEHFSQLFQQLSGC